MIGRFIGSLFATMLGLMGAAGLPVAIDDSVGHKIGNVCRKVDRNKRKRPAEAPAGHRRQYIPLARRKSCRFVYARADRQASRDARMRVIRNNDRIENLMQGIRIQKAGLRAA